MKVLIFSALIICLVGADFWETIENSFSKEDLECLEKSHMDKKTFMQYMDKTLHFPKGDAKLNEVLACTAFAKNALTESGNFKQDMLEKSINKYLSPFYNKTDDPDFVSKLSAKCIGVKGESIGDRMVELHNCLIDSVTKV
ncbi:hypothetical protein FQA39_LY08217 [Lamprigera yunnana]|nr:hypothetical protein FQA39_LY08217 [Lamprigera yunnana]